MSNTHREQLSPSPLPRSGMKPLYPLSLFYSLSSFFRCLFALRSANFDPPLDDAGHALKGARLQLSSARASLFAHP